MSWQDRLKQLREGPNKSIRSGVKSLMADPSQADMDPNEIGNILRTSKTPQAQTTSSVLGHFAKPLGFAGGHLAAGAGALSDLVQGRLPDSENIQQTLRESQDTAHDTLADMGTDYKTYLSGLLGVGAKAFNKMPAVLGRTPTTLSPTRVGPLTEPIMPPPGMKPPSSTLPVQPSMRSGPGLKTDYMRAPSPTPLVRPVSPSMPGSMPPTPSPTGPGLTPSMMSTALGGGALAGTLAGTSMASDTPPISPPSTGPKSYRELFPTDRPGDYGSGTPEALADQDMALFKKDFAGRMNDPLFRQKLEALLRESSQNEIQNSPGIRGQLGSPSGY